MSRLGSCLRRWLSLLCSPSPAAGSAFRRRSAARIALNTSSTPVFNAAAPLQALHAGPVDDMLERILACISVLAAVLGLLLADYFYRRRPDAAPALAKKLGGLYTTLLHKYWVDEIYAKVIVMPLLMFSRFFLFYVVDKGVVEGSAAAAAGSTRGVGSILRRMQSGNIRSYAGWLAAGAAILLAVTIFGRAIFLH